jgi:hypothetical protein
MTRLHLKDIKKGDEFYEFGYGVRVYYVAKTDMREEEGGWAVIAEGVDTGEEQYFFNHKNYPAYHPNIYKA